MYNTTTGTIVAQLTRYGRQLLADNSANFRITQYQFSDDEINYADFDGSSTDAPNTAILKTPILEANSVGGTPSQRYTLFTSPSNTLQIARLDSNVQLPFVDGQQDERPSNNREFLVINTDTFNVSNPFKFLVRTFYGHDGAYLLSDNSAFINEIGEGFVEEMPFQRGSGAKFVQPFPKVEAVPCPDPSETLQNQTQSEIPIYITIQPTSLVAATFSHPQLYNFNNRVDLGKLIQLNIDKKFSGQDFVLALLALEQQGFFGTTQRGTIDPAITYGQFGMAMSDLRIVGSDTGKVLTISILLYSSQVLTSTVGFFIQNGLIPS